MEVGRQGLGETALRDLDLTPWIRSTVGVRLGYVLERRDMSRRELARLSGVSEACLSRILNCQRIPNPDALVRICITLGVSSDWLLGLKQVPPRRLRAEAGRDDERRREIGDSNLPPC